MKTDGGWVSISECARLYGRHRKWVYDQIKRYGIETHKEGNRTRLRLVDSSSTGASHRTVHLPTMRLTLRSHRKSHPKSHRILTLKRNSSSKRMVFCAGVSRNWRQTGRNGRQGRRVGRRNGRGCRGLSRGRHSHYRLRSEGDGLRGCRSGSRHGNVNCEVRTGKTL